MSDEQKPEQQHDEPVEDLDVEESEAENVKGGLIVRMAGGKADEYLRFDR